MEKEVEELSDEFAELFQELPKGGVKERTIKHCIPTIPAEVPVYKDQLTHSRGVDSRNSRNT